VDANLQKPCQLADHDDWTFGAGATWDARGRMARLVGARVPTWQEDTAAGAARVARIPGSIDRFATAVRVEHDQPARWRVIASGGAPGETVLFDSATEITDAAIGHDEVLYVAIGGTVRLHDLRGRWADTDVAIPGGAWRLAAAPVGCYVASAPAAGSAIGRVVGQPMRPLPFRHAGDVFRPTPEDPDPPRYEPVTSVPTDVTTAGIAASPGGRLALLAWNAAGDASLFVFDGAFGAPRTLAGTQRPYSLTWLDDDRIAVLIATTGDGTVAAAYDVAGTGIAPPVGELYPLRAAIGDPFLHGDDLPPRYPSTGGIARPLVPVSWPSFVDHGELRGSRFLDGERTATTWHRIYLEAAIPATTSIRVWLAASDDRVEPPASEWFEHRFGNASDAGDDVPRGVWTTEGSEIPFHAPLLPCPARPHVAGLFTALVQRGARRVRALTGRFLWVRIELVGDGRTTPELAALRVYANRRGYAQLYLPELYREDVYGVEANSVEPATPADFLDRMLGTFESFLTPLEGRIASAWLLTAPRAVPAEALDWLASWLGFVFAADLPTLARRAMLERAWELYQKRGTLAGLRLALELATIGDDGVGAVTRGEVVVVEDFRLRRTFSTILGADLSDPGDPLLPGLIVSGNSLVGDTLFLGEEDNRAFLAVFAPELDDAQGRHDEAAVLAFFDRLAHRATVLVHQEMRDQDLGLLRQIVDLEAPAHVEVKIVTATYRFRVAMSSLLGIDTFLAPKPAPGPVALDRSHVGVRDVIARLPSLDPRLGRS
jgi:phage tail-like protein